MVDLRVDTAALWAASRELRTVAAVVEQMMDRGGARELVPAAGLARAMQATEEFLAAWGYGLRCIGVQAQELAGQVATAATTYEMVEARLTAGAGGSTHHAAPPAAPAPPADPVRIQPRSWGLAVGPPVQLSQAVHVGQLIPGDPAEMARLGRAFVAFADEAVDARLHLARISIGTWIGGAAEAVTAELEQLAQRLTAADHAFADAGTAIARYADVHADARAQAAAALSMWQEAAPVSAAARGAVVGVAVPAAAADADAAMARAGAMVNAARDELENAARVLAEALDAAQAEHPKDPGLFSVIRRVVTSFTVGVAEGIHGIGTGTVELGTELGELAYRINPARAYYDPEGYQAASDALWGAVARAARNPGAVGKALIDYEAWQEDPARALGRLVPDLVGIVATAGAVGAAKGATVTARIQYAGHIAADPGFAALHVSPARIAGQVADLGLNPASAVGRGAVSQLRIPGASADQWVPAGLKDGQRIAVGGPGGQLMTPVAGDLPSDARAFYQPLQYPALRSFLPDGTPTAPLFPSEIQVFVVHGDLPDAAFATALANPQFGEGGGTLLSVANRQQLIAEGRLEHIDAHQFDADSLRSPMEDPFYRAADPSLPERALDPDREGLISAARNASEGIATSAGNTAVVIGAGEASEQIDTSPDRIGEGAR